MEEKKDLEESKASLNPMASDFSPEVKNPLKADAQDFKPQGEAIIQSYEDQVIPHCRSAEKFEGRYGNLNFVLGDNIFCYDCLEDTWVSYSEWSVKSRAPEAKYYRSIMIASHSFIITGGLSGSALKHSYHIDIFKDFDNVQSSMNVYEMQEARYLHSMVVQNNTVFAIGGQASPNEYLASVEAFEDNAWVNKPSLNKARSFFTVIVNNSAIWVAGGFCAANENCQSIEKFDGRSWQLIEVCVPMFAGMGIAPRDRFNNCFYVFGGSDGVKTYDRFLVFNTENSSFEEEQIKLIAPRAGCSVCWVGDCFWLVGGGPLTGEMWLNGQGKETKAMPLSIYSQIEAASFMKTRD